ncbi:MAG: hypothetical protein QM581_16790 [Pseudomonas sp.]
MNPRLALLVAVVLMSSSCTADKPAEQRKSVMQHIRLDGDRVGANAVDGRIAWLTADGTLEIDGKPVVLSPDQKALAQRYHTTAFRLREQSVALGGSGAELGVQAIRSVASGLAAGKPDQIGPEIDARAKALQAQVRELCDRIGELRANQDALASALPAFRPYATIDDSVAADCRTK